MRCRNREAYRKIIRGEDAQGVEKQQQQEEEEEEEDGLRPRLNTKFPDS